MLPLFKKIITALVLLSFLMIVLFSFSVIMNGSDGRMPENCPFSGMGVSLCPQDTVALVFHHISSYESFTNVPINFSLTVLIISLLFIAFITFRIFLDLLSLGLPDVFSILYNFPQATSYKRKIMHWLSLFENSPSFMYARHS